MANKMRELTSIIGPKILPSPKAPVFIALIKFFKLSNSSSPKFLFYLSLSSIKILFNAGTQLLFIKAPPIPPINIPTHIILTSLGNILGTGPEKIIDITKKIVPNATSFG